MIKVNGEVVNVKHFPDGTQLLNFDYFNASNDVLVIWNYEKDEEMFTLYSIVKHLQGKGRPKITLYLPYLPNARMDRVKNDGEIFTLKYFAMFINDLDFDNVILLDVHSDVGKALINRAICVEPETFINETIEKINRDEQDLIIYFPDAGAQKRYSSLINGDYVTCYGEKKRDWETGKILGLNVVIPEKCDINGKSVLMIDDICSYGGTLHHSANKLHELGAREIYGYVTHCENNILYGDLINNPYVNHFFTTDSIFTDNNEKIEVMSSFSED